MKRCPECDSVFLDSDQFCELDGTRLVADHSHGNPVVGDRAEQRVQQVSGTDSKETARQPEQSWKTLAMVGVAGVAVGVVLFLVYYGLTRQAPTQSSNDPSSNVGGSQQQIPLLASRSSPVPSASPSAEPSPSPSALPSPSVRAASAKVELSSGSVSTGGDEKTRSGPVTIRLTNGSSVEADEAWETGEGIWYRRRGILTLLKRKQVKAIEKASPSPTVSPPSASQSSPP